MLLLPGFGEKPGQLIARPASTVEKYLRTVRKLKTFEEKFDFILPSHNGTPIDPCYIDWFITLARMILDGYEGKEDCSSPTFGPHLGHFPKKGSKLPQGGMERRVSHLLRGSNTGLIRGLLEVKMFSKQLFSKDQKKGKLYFYSLRLLLSVYPWVFLKTYTTNFYKTIGMGTNDRTILEPIREIPGLLMMFIVAAISFLTLGRMGAVAMVIRAAGLLLIGQYAKTFSPVFSGIYGYLVSLGDHIFTPLRKQHWHLRSQHRL